MALMQFEELEVPRVKVERAVQYVDHNVVQLDNKNPDDHRMLQALARKHGLHFSRPGNGISHYIHMERYGKPGHTMLGADSHTTQAGCMGMIAIGAGGLDVAVVLGGYPYEISCPEVVEVRLEGKLSRPWVQAKDIILELLRRLSASGGKNKVFEFTGPGTHDLSIPERATIANMIADLGGTAGLFAPDENTKDWLERHGHARLAPDPGRDRRIRGLPSAFGRRGADARACVRPVRRHGSGAAVGRELAAHLQPQLPRALRHAGGLGVPLLAGRRGCVAA